MSDITATLRLESPTLALTETVAADDSATVQPVPGAGTVPDAGSYLFTIQSADFDRFETALVHDRTIADFERLTSLDSEAVYRFEYAPEATLFSPVIASVDGVSLDWTNDGTVWTVRVWLPSRGALATLWEYATDHDITCVIEQVHDYSTSVGTNSGLTEAQKEALLLALEMGYFEEPREASLSDVAAELGISQPAAGGLLRRGMKRLLNGTVADDSLGW